MNQKRLDKNRKYWNVSVSFVFVFFCRGNGADWRKSVSSICDASATMPGGITRFQAGCSRQRNAVKPSVGPDFLDFLSKTDFIRKKHMFFDKKYILFSAF